MSHIDASVQFGHNRTKHNDHRQAAASQGLPPDPGP